MIKKTLVEYLVEKVKQEKININKEKNETLAHLYLCKLKKGSIYYYPNKRGYYEIHYNGKERFDFKFLRNPEDVN